MQASTISWKPSASFALIKLRAETLRKIRHFFYAREVLEVDTPTLSCSTVPDPFIESFQTRYIPLTRTMQHENYYLHTSPEFPMKRLLACGSGSIYQISKVFRSQCLIHTIIGLRFRINQAVLRFIHGDDYNRRNYLKTLGFTCCIGNYLGFQKMSEYHKLIPSLRL